MLLGLTGPIGCGKSTVAAMLGDLGGTVIDADALARDVTNPGEPALAAIRDRFGPAVLDHAGVLDRSALAAIVFADAAALHDLESIVHPYVRARVTAALARARADEAPFVVIEAIKLIEGGLADGCDEVWVIDCTAAEQRDRLQARGLSAEDIERRLAAQGADLAARLSRDADRVIVTSGSLESIRERVEDALADLLAPVFPGLPLGPVERSSGRR